MFQPLKGHLQGFFCMVSETGYSSPSTEEIQQRVETNLYSPVRLQGVILNHLTPNGQYMGRTAQLISRCCILYIYSTNIRTEYFKHAAYLRFFLFKMPFLS